MIAGDNIIQVKVMDEYGLWSTADAGFVSLAVPEPAALGTLAIGGLALLRRRRTGKPRGM